MSPNRSRAFLFVIVSFAALAVSAQTSLPEGVERVTSVEGITEYRLDNGLQVLLFPDPSKATITVNVTYLVGSVHEAYGETGMAHLLEHMLFKGTPNHPEVVAELQDRGAQFNGTTSWERTNYYETFDATPENLEWALELEADRMVNSYVRQQDLDSEMTVVRNEFEASESNSPSVLLYRVLDAAYTWHGYGKPPIGSRSDIENVPIERLQAFYRNFYQPDNAVLVIAGRIDEADTLERIVTHFGSIPRPERRLIQNYTKEPVQEGERQVELRRVGDLQFLMVGYHTAGGTHEDFVPLQIATHALSNEPSGRLYQALVQPGLAAQVGVQTLQLKDPGMMIFVAIVRADQDLDVVRETMLATIDELKADPLTEEEVERARNQMLTGFEQQMNNSQAVALQLSNWAAIGDWRMMFLDRDRVREATMADARAAAAHYFKPSNRTVGMFYPEETPDRTDIPESPVLASLLAGYTGDEGRAIGEAFDPSPANIDARTERMILPGGTKLAMLAKETRGDSVNAVIRLNFGDEESLRGLARTASMTAQMLMRGTTSHSRQEIQDELARLQSRLNVSGGYSGAFVNIQT
ncbi:MAG: insulinase family protein, partial [Gammaproteobacteria bacterium]